MKDFRFSLARVLLAYAKLWNMKVDTYFSRLYHDTNHIIWSNHVSLRCFRRFYFSYTLLHYYLDHFHQYYFRNHHHICRIDQMPLRIWPGSWRQKLHRHLTLPPCPQMHFPLRAPLSARHLWTQNDGYILGAQKPKPTSPPYSFRHSLSCASISGISAHFIYREYLRK